MDDETRTAKLAELRERIRLARDTRTSEAQTDVLMVQKMATASKQIIVLVLNFLCDNTNIWTRIKRIREVQGFSSTSIKLMLKKVASNPEEVILF